VRKRFPNTVRDGWRAATSPRSRARPSAGEQTAMETLGASPRKNCPNSAPAAGELLAQQTQLQLTLLRQQREARTLAQSRPRSATSIRRGRNLYPRRTGQQLRKVPSAAIARATALKIASFRRKTARAYYRRALQGHGLRVFRTTRFKNRAQFDLAARTLSRRQGLRLETNLLDGDSNRRRLLYRHCPPATIDNRGVCRWRPGSGDILAGWLRTSPC
jgi:hypothetical protein